MSEYQTYLFDCQCHISVRLAGGVIPRIIFKNLIPYCAWCRTPLVRAALMNYDDSHFPKEESR